MTNVDNYRFKSSSRNSNSDSAWRDNTLYKSKMNNTDNYNGNYDQDTDSDYEIKLDQNYNGTARQSAYFQTEKVADMKNSQDDGIQTIVEPETERNQSYE